MVLTQATVLLEQKGDTGINGIDGIKRCYGSEEMLE
jgi:hypothetical protein